jgi:ABC-2 type transport system ATP-binding protein
VAQTNDLPARRVDEVLEIVGLTSVARKRTRGFSLGMGQRLGIATALLGDPKILLLDEPVNGLDPEGILWVRNLLKHFAAVGKTIFVSSHLMSEMALTADRVIVVGRGRLIADATTEELIARSGSNTVRVRTPQPESLLAALGAAGLEATRGDDGALVVTGSTTDRVGELAAANHVVLHELSLQQGSLETAFMELTEGAVDFRAGDAPGRAPRWEHGR